MGAKLLGKRRLKFAELPILIVAVALFLFLSVAASPHFLSVGNIQNMLLQSVFVMLVGFGMTFVLTIGGIDLSVGSIIGISGAGAGLAIAAGANTVAGFLAGVLVGGLCGLVNGLLITKVKIAPFLTTFAMLSVLRGIVQLLTTNGSVTGFSTAGFLHISQGYLFGIPIPVIITAVVFVILLFIYKCTSYGRYIVAIGYNEDAAFMSGISVHKLKICAYVVSGLAAGVSGVLLASRLASVPATMGESYEMNAIAVAVIGGTSMSGGKGSMFGAIIGGLILGMITNGLDLLSVNQFYRQVIIGVVILVAVSLDRYNSRKSEKI